MDIKSVTEVKPRSDIPTFAAGDTIKANIKVVEGDKERIQAFQGVVIRVKKGGINSSFTVRKVASGVGVERTFFFHSPRLEKVEVVRHGKVRRAKLYYLRGLSGRAGRIKEGTRKLPEELKVEVAKEAVAATTAAAAPESATPATPSITPTPEPASTPTTETPPTTKA